MNKQYKKSMKKIAPINKGKISAITDFHRAEKKDVTDNIEEQWRINSKYFCFEETTNDKMADPNTKVMLWVDALGHRWFIIDNEVYRHLKKKEKYEHSIWRWESESDKTKRLNEMKRIYCVKAGKRIRKELEKKVNITNLEEACDE